jgi:zinc protease
VVFPTQEELEGVIAKVQSSKIEKYEDNVGSQPLISDELKGSEVVEEFSLPGIDAKGFVLGNGAKVVMMPTEHSDDEIIFSAFSFGGSSLLEDEDLYSANITTSIAQQSGLGEFDMIQLQKKLSGKMAMVNPSLSELTEGLSGSSNIKDIETLLQLCYMRFESPRFDKKAYQVFVNQMETIMSNLKADNNQAMQDTIALVSSNHSPRTITLNDDFLKNIDFNKIEEIYKQRFRNASDFTFVMVGNVDIERDLPLVKKYIGSIGTENTSEVYVDQDMGPADGESRVHFERDMEVAKTTIFTSFSGKMKFSRKNQLCVSTIGKLLDKRYMETIREEEGGSYGVSVGASLGRLPEPEYTMVVRFDTDPEKKDRLLEIVHQEIKKLSKDGADTQDLEEVKKAIIKVRKEQLDKNGFWLGAIQTSLMYEEDFLSMDDYESLVNSITEKDIKKISKKMFYKPDLVEVIMNPKK